MPRTAAAHEEAEREAAYQIIDFVRLNHAQRRPLKAPKSTKTKMNRSNGCQECKRLTEIWTAVGEELYAGDGVDMTKRLHEVHVEERFVERMRMDDGLCYEGQENDTDADKEEAAYEDSSDENAAWIE